MKTAFPSIRKSQSDSRRTAQSSQDFNLLYKEKQNLISINHAERDPQFTWKSCSAERKAAFQEAKDQVLDGGLTAPAHPSQ